VRRRLTGPLAGLAQVQESRGSSGEAGGGGGWWPMIPHRGGGCPPPSSAAILLKCSNTSVRSRTPRRIKRNDRRAVRNPNRRHAAELPRSAGFCGEAATFLKRQNPHSTVEVKDLKSSGVTRRRLQARLMPLKLRPTSLGSGIDKATRTTPSTAAAGKPGRRGRR
jgi:hypothetical protein